MYSECEKFQDGGRRQSHQEFLLSERMLPTNWQLSPLENSLNRHFPLCPVYSSRTKLSPGRKHFVESEVDARTLHLSSSWGDCGNPGVLSLVVKVESERVSKSLVVTPFLKLTASTSALYSPALAKCQIVLHVQQSGILTGDSRTPGTHYGKKQNQSATIP